MTITICGGGSLGHTCAGMFSRLGDVKVNMLTNHPERWNRCFDVFTHKGDVLHARLEKISASPEDLIPVSDIVLFCLPAFMVEEEVKKIAPFIRFEAMVGTVVGNSGFFLYCHKYLPAGTCLFGFQRVPYVSRVIEYGKSANLLGDRPRLIVAEENISDRNAFGAMLKRLFDEDIVFADSYYEVTLSNSNPILHTGRLYTMWKDWDGAPFEECGLFYKDWTVEASALEIRMDEEFFRLLEALNVNTEHIDTLLEHYEADDALEMTRKIQTIESFQSIKSPMVQTDKGWMPDFGSRYFTEDFPFGLRMIRDLAHENGVECPAIDMVYEWGMSKCGNN